MRGRPWHRQALLCDAPAVILNDLSGTEYESSDPAVQKYGLKAYLGFPVAHRDRTVGSLCVVDGAPRDFDHTDGVILNVLAKAMAVEEERKALESELQEKLALIEQQEIQLRQQTQ